MGLFLSTLNTSTALLVQIVLDPRGRLIQATWRVKYDDQWDAVLVVDPDRATVVRIGLPYDQAAVPLTTLLADLGPGANAVPPVVVVACHTVSRSGKTGSASGMTKSSGPAPGWIAITPPLGSSAA